MKFNTYFATAVLVSASTVFGGPLAEHDAAHHANRASMGATAGIVNAPLTDWIKNGNTDLQWYTTISVGTPPQNFTVLIDTGSHALLLPQSKCTTCGASSSSPGEAVPPRRLFDPSRSSTFAWSALGPLDLTFGTGGDTVPLAPSAPAQGARCNMATDDVAIRGLAAPAYPFALCWEEEGDALASQPGIDGILGLGLYDAAGTGTSGADGDDGSPAPPRSLQWALLDAGVLRSGVFGLHLPAGAVEGGALTLGGVDEARFDGDVAWLPLDLHGHTTWTLDMETVFVGGEQLMVPPTASNATANGSSPSTSSSSSTGTGTTRDAVTTTPYPPSLAQVLDTGTPFLMAPDYATAAALYAQLSPFPGALRQLDPDVGTWGGSCDTMESLAQSGSSASLTFLLGRGGNDSQQLNVTLPASTFDLGPYPNMPGVCQAAVSHWTDGGAYYEGLGLWLLGSPLLKEYYTAWDGLGLRVGFAKLKDSTSKVNSTTTSAAAVTTPTARRKGAC